MVFVIIKNLKKSIKIEDLHEFVRPAMKKGLFSKSGSIESIKIIRIVDGRGRIIERHGILRVSQGYKKQAIKSIRGLLPDKEHLVDEYVIRHWSNDRRTHHQALVAYPNDRRKGDRRRSGLRLHTPKSESTPSHSDFVH
jgi:hypothetical protein